MKEYIYRALGFIIDLLFAGFIGAIIGISLSLTLGFYIAVVFFLSKDLWFQEGSFGKKKLGLKLTSNVDSRITAGVNKIIRNITLFIWPIECVFVIINKGRRIGDLIGNTSVQLLEKE
ncbi:RDD family protein [Flavilitoribacter nigricans]|nr:hypothetical protein [Flavilitoribacter nigricans]